GSRPRCRRGSGRAAGREPPSLRRRSPLSAALPARPPSTPRRRLPPPRLLRARSRRREVFFDSRSPPCCGSADCWLLQILQPSKQKLKELRRIDVDADMRVGLPFGASPQVDVGPPPAQLAARVDLHAALERLD